MKTVNKEKHLARIAIAGSVTGVVESGSLGVVYGGLFADFFGSPIGQAIGGVASQFLFPLILAAGMTDAILSWIKVGLDRNKHNSVKKRNVVNASVSTASLAGFGVAVIGLMVAAPIFSQFAPIIFMAVIGARTLYNLGAGIFYKRHASKLANEAKKEKYTALGNSHLKNAAFGAIALAATTAVFFLGYLAVAPLGVVLNAVFLAMSVVGLVMGIKKYFGSSGPSSQATAEVVSDVRYTPVVPRPNSSEFASKNSSGGMRLFDHRNNEKPVDEIVVRNVPG